MLGEDDEVKKPRAKWGSKREIVIRHPDFGARLHEAADMSPSVPPKGEARYGEIARIMRLKGEEVHSETIRKWFAGEMRPRSEGKLKVLAEALKVDYAWLASGRNPAAAAGITAGAIDRVEVGRSERQLPPESALVRALVELSGATLATSAGADSSGVDFEALKGRVFYRFRVVEGRLDGDGYLFTVPKVQAGVLIFGLVWLGDMKFRVFELDPEKAAADGMRRGTSFEIRISAEAPEHAEILSFEDRL